MSQTDQERAIYETIWTLPAYAEHAPGEQYLPLFQAMVQEHARLIPAMAAVRSMTVLDAGTGSGKGALALQRAGYRVTACDLTPDGLVPDARDLPFVSVCLWQDVEHACGRYDWVYCTDVLEHIPPVYAALVAWRLLRCARSAAFFSVSLVPDVFGAWVGKPLHQTVMPYRVWRETFAELGTVVDARDLGQTGIYLVAPR